MSRFDVSTIDPRVPAEWPAKPPQAAVSAAC